MEAINMVYQSYTDGNTFCTLIIFELERVGIVTFLERRQQYSFRVVLVQWEGK